ncbi:hypothetical protein A4A49_66086, partial [Nicotiana attenuata]
LIEARETSKQVTTQTKKRENQVNHEKVEIHGSNRNLKMAVNEVEIEQIRGKEKDENRGETPCRIELPSQLEIDTVTEAVSNGTVMAGNNEIVQKVENSKTDVQEWEEG